MLANRPGSQSLFQFMPKVLDVVHTSSSTPNWGQHFFMDLAFYTEEIVMLRDTTVRQFID